MNSQTLTISNFADLLDFARGLDLPEMRKMVLSLEEIMEDKREANREAYAAQANFNLCEDAVCELGLKHLRLADWSVLEMLGLDQLEGPEYWDITALEAPASYFIDQSIFLKEDGEVFSTPVLTTIGETLKELDWETLANLTGEVGAMKRSLQKTNSRISGMTSSDPVAVLSELPRLHAVQDEPTQARRGG